MAKTARSHAYHEAGHAVAYFVFGRRFRSITIHPMGGEVLEYPSRLRQDPSHGLLPFNQVPRDIDERVMISMAGEIAQSKGSPHSVRVGHAQSDRNAQANWLFNLPGWGEYVAYCKARLRKTFADPVIWAGVEAVARALMKRNRLSYSEAHTAYMDASDAKVRRRSRRVAVKRKPPDKST
jgi:hypothetical protein